MNTISYNPIDTSISYVIKECINHLTVQAIPKKITLKHYSAEDYSVRCDVKMIQTVLRNLISNAIKFSHKDSIIEIPVIDNPEDMNYVRVAIVDTGIGMSSEDLNKLFKIDDKIVSSRGTNDETGTGLGLILCKEFIDKHNCKL